jgi:glycogen(starch) synthase
LIINYLFFYLNKIISVGGIYTVIRSKVPITKKEYGNNYICLGPYNDSFVKTEVEVSEPKIDAVRETVNEMRRFGIHVSLMKKMNMYID